jgi:hypothetical protein
MLLASSARVASFREEARRGGRVTPAATGSHLDVVPPRHQDLCRVAAGQHDGRRRRSRAHVEPNPRPRLAPIARMSALPWFLPGLAVWFVVSLRARRSVGRALGVRPSVAWALLIGFGMIVSATLTPLHGELSFKAIPLGGCDLSRIGIASAKDLLSLGDATLNVPASSSRHSGFRSPSRRSNCSCQCSVAAVRARISWTI